MKIKVLLSLFACMFFISCSSNNPKDVAQNFLDSFNHGEFEKAKEYCDKPTANLVGMVENAIPKDSLKRNSVKVEITKVEEDGDKATVYYTQDNDNEARPLTLKKVDGDWKVSVDKEGAKESADKMLGGYVESDSTDVASLEPVDSTTTAE